MFNLIRNLSSRNELVYLSFARREDLLHLDAVRPYCAEVITVPFPSGGSVPFQQKALYLARRCLHNILSAVTLTPVLVWKCRSGAMRRELHRAIERSKPDIVHICFAQMADYVQECQGVSAVMDTQDVATVSALRRARCAPNFLSKAYYFLQWLFWRRYESRYYPKFGKVLTLTRQDAAALKTIDPSLDIYPDAIGIDIGPPAVLERQDKACRIGFLASFGHQPNVDAALYFVETILPLIRARLADVEFVVAGRNPPEALGKMSADGVRCVGFVEDVSSFYGSVDVVVAPLRFGGGIKIKVLEAMACGKPVVTTSIGAEGIASPEDGALLMADEPAAFASCVCRLLNEPELARNLGDRGRELVIQRFSWKRVTDDLGRIYADLAREVR